MERQLVTYRSLALLWPLSNVTLIAEYSPGPNPEATSTTDGYAILENHVCDVGLSNCRVDLPPLVRNFEMQSWHIQDWVLPFLYSTTSNLPTPPDLMSAGHFDQPLSTIIINVNATRTWKTPMLHTIHNGPCRERPTLAYSLEGLARRQPISQPHARLYRLFSSLLRSIFYSADALASASCRCGGNRYLSWLVYVVRSSVICLSPSTISFRVPSLPLNCPLVNCSRCRTQHTIVHISKFGTLIDTGCDRLENLDAYARIVLASPPASSGRISKLRIFWKHIQVSKQYNSTGRTWEGMCERTSRDCAHCPASTRLLMLLSSSRTRQATLFWS